MEIVACKLELFKNPIIDFINQEIRAEREWSRTWLLQLCLRHKQTKLRSMPIWNPVSEYQLCSRSEHVWGWLIDLVRSDCRKFSLSLSRLMAGSWSSRYLALTHSAFFTEKYRGKISPLISLEIWHSYPSPTDTRKFNFLFKKVKIIAEFLNLVLFGVCYFQLNSAERQHQQFIYFQFPISTVRALIKKKIKFSSYIRKFRVEQLQSNIRGSAS